MTPKEMVFSVWQRSECEWILRASLDGSEGWIIKKWEKKPTEAEIQEVQDITMKACELYHRSMRIPRFSLMAVRREA